MLPVEPSLLSGAVEQPLQIFNLLASLASSARFWASCLSHSLSVTGLLSAGTSKFGWTAGFLGCGTVFLAGVISSGAGPRPSQATFGPTIGASQVVPEAQHPASVIAANKPATYFSIISAPRLSNATYIPLYLGHEQGVRLVHPDAWNQSSSRLKRVSYRLIARRERQALGSRN